MSRGHRAETTLAPAATIPPTLPSFPCNSQEGPFLKQQGDRLETGNRHPVKKSLRHPLITHPDLKNQRYRVAEQEGPPPSTQVLGLTAPFPALASGCIALLKKDAKIAKILPALTRQGREHLSFPEASAESSYRWPHTNLIPVKTLKFKARLTSVKQRH